MQVRSWPFTVTKYKNTRVFFFFSQFNHFWRESPRFNFLQIITWTDYVLLHDHFESMLADSYWMLPSSVSSMSRSIPVITSPSTFWAFFKKIYWIKSELEPSLSITFFFFYFSLLTNHSFFSTFQGKRYASITNMEP